jgi:hypothetical protein
MRSDVGAMGFATAHLITVALPLRIAVRRCKRLRHQHFRVLA